MLDIIVRAGRNVINVRNSMHAAQTAGEVKGRLHST